MSGSFGESYGAKEYLIHFDNQRHKIYFEGTVERLYREFQQKFFSHMAAKAPELDRLSIEAKKHKIPLVPINLGWPKVWLENSADISGLSKTSYPLLLSLPIQIPQDGGLYQVDLALTSPVKSADMKWLSQKLLEILSARDDEDRTSPEADLEAYQVPVVSKLQAGYALRAGTLVKTTKDATAFYQQQLQTILDKAAAALDKEFSRPEFEKEAQVKFVPLSNAFGKQGGQGGGNFDPWKSDVKEASNVEIVRPRYQGDTVMLNALLAIRKNGSGHNLDTIIPALLAKTLVSDEAHYRAVMTDTWLIRLHGAKVDSNVFYELGEIKDDRVVQALAEYLTRSGISGEQQSYALEPLKKVVGQGTPDKIVDRLVGYYRGLKDGFSLQQSTLQVLGRIPTRYAAAQLVHLYLASSLSDSGNPYFLRQDILSALGQIGDPAHAVLEKALQDRAVKNDEKRRRELSQVLENLK